MLSTGLSTASQIATAAMGILTPLMMMHNQFGQGSPALDTSAYPPALGTNLATNLGAATGGDWSGTGAGEYATNTTNRATTNTRLHNLDSHLKKTLTTSGENSRLGRAKIQQIMDTVNMQLTTLQPISATAAGQAQIVRIITQAITQAGGVVSAGHSASGVNAADVKALAAQYATNSTSSGTGSDISSTTTDGKKVHTVDEAIDGALDALHITDPAARARWRAGYRTLVSRESGGRVNAENDVDSNAAAGNPSKGLTQCTQTTFDAYHVAGTPKDIEHPVSSVAASMNYVMHRYDVDPSGINLTRNVQQADATRPAKGY